MGSWRGRSISPSKETSCYQSTHSSHPGTHCARGQIPRLSDGTGTDKAEGKMTLCGYATGQTTKRSPKDPWTTARTLDTTSPDLDMSQAHYHMCPPSTCECPHLQSKTSLKHPLKPPETSSKMNCPKGSRSVAWKHSEHTTHEGGCGSSDGIHMDGCRRWDAGEHEAGVGGAGVLEWG